MYKNLKLIVKNSISLFLTIILFVTSAVIVFTLINVVGDDVDTIERRGDRTVSLTEMGSQFRSKDTRISDYIIFKEDTYIDEFEEKRILFNELEAKIRPEMDTEEQLELYNQIVENDKMVNSIFLDEIVPAVKQGNSNDYLSLRLETSKLRSETDDLLDSLRTIVENEQLFAVEHAKSNVLKTYWTLIISIIISTVIGAATTIILNKRLVSRIKNIAHFSNEVSEGNLAIERINDHSGDELGDLSNSVNDMKDNLTAIIKQVISASDELNKQNKELNRSVNEVNEGNIQIASTMKDLSEGAEEQASSASTLAQSMDEFLSQIQTADQSGEELKLSSKEVLGLTNNGNSLMAESENKMDFIYKLVKDSMTKVEGLDNQTKEISNLVSVIKDIADQTNLLALNAAIEAARAGEHGKGFAVVADEVRKLAEQVSESVSSITKIVSGVQSESGEVVNSLQTVYKNVEEGAEQINTTGKTFEEINDSITHMQVKIASISESLKQISERSKGMSSSIDDIASISEESSAGVEETTASIEQSKNAMGSIVEKTDGLSDLSTNLTKSVSIFRLK